MSFEAALASLKEAVRSVRPDLVRKKRPSKIPIDAVHPDLAVLWNGLSLQPILESDLVQPAASERDDWWLFERWLTPREAIREGRILRKIASFPETLVPVATNDGGDFTCQDRDTGKLYWWSHETHKAKARRGTLDSVVKQMAKVAIREAKLQAAAATKKTTKRTATKSKASQATAKAPGLPKKIVPGKSMILRKILAEHGRDAQFHAVALAPDGDLFALVSKSRTVDFGSFDRDERVIYDEPATQRAQAEHGFSTMHAESVTCDAHGGVLVIIDNELQCWRWADGKLALETRARWTGGKDGGHSRMTFGNENVRLTQDRIALIATEGLLSDNTTYCVAIWDRSTFPKAKSLAGKPKEHPAPVRIPIARSYGTQIDLAPNGDVLIAESPEYNEVRLSRWNAQGKCLGRTKLEGSFAGFRFLTADKIVALGQDYTASSFFILDEALKIEREVEKAHAGRAVALAVAPSGAFFATTAGDEVNLWSASDFTQLAARKDKKLGKWRGLSVLGLADRRLFAEAPVSLLELK